MDFSKRDALILKHLPLVKLIAHKLARKFPKWVVLDDLVSAGTIGLIQACERYDESRPNKFNTYAEFRIRGAMLDELRDLDTLTRHTREKMKLFEDVFLETGQKLGRAPERKDMEEALGMSPDEYFKLYRRLHQNQPVPLKMKMEFKTNQGKLTSHPS